MNICVYILIFAAFELEIRALLKYTDKQKITEGNLKQKYEIYFVESQEKNFVLFIRLFIC